MLIKTNEMLLFIATIYCHSNWSTRGAWGFIFIRKLMKTCCFSSCSLGSLSHGRGIRDKGITRPCGRTHWRNPHVPGEF